MPNFMAKNGHRPKIVPFVNAKLSRYERRRLLYRPDHFLLARRKNAKNSHWRGPGVIQGRHTHMAMISYLTHNFNVSLQNLRSCESMFLGIGVAEVLQLFSNGGQIKLKDIPCSQTIELMQRYANLKQGEKLTYFV